MERSEARWSAAERDVGARAGKGLRLQHAGCCAHDLRRCPDFGAEGSATFTEDSAYY
jgi:hypothetical protein